jgi:hypothetical protein
MSIARGHSTAVDPATPSEDHHRNGLGEDLGVKHPFGVGLKQTIDWIKAATTTPSVA